jgi:hypothetical protein
MEKCNLIQNLFGGGAGREAETWTHGLDDNWSIRKEQRGLRNNIYSRFCVAFAVLS